MKEHLRVSAFPSSPLAILVALCAGMALLAAGTPSHAQTWPWQSAPVKVHKRVSKHVVVRKVEPFAAEEPMKLGLGLLTGGASPADQLFEQLKKASIQDLEYAKALADGVKDSPGAVARSKCYGAWLGMMASLSSANAAVNGTALGQPTGAAQLFTKFEQLSQVADNLAPLSTFQQACAPVAQAMRMNMQQFVLAVVGGGLSLGKLGVLP